MDNLAVLKYPSLVLLAVIGWVHLKDIPDKLTETPYMGWMYILLVAGCAAAGAWILSSHWRFGYILGSIISLGSILGYTLTRTIGLPKATEDIGNWTEPAGIIALLAEAAFLIISYLVLSKSSQSSLLGFRNRI